MYFLRRAEESLIAHKEHIVFLRHELPALTSGSWSFTMLS